MKTYTYSEAQQNFSSVLDAAQQEGGVRVLGRDGSAFDIQPARDEVSPLAVEPVKLKLKRATIVAAVRESRRR